MRASARKAGRKVEEEKVKGDVLKLKKGVEEDSSPYKMSSWIHDDGIIDTRDMRDVFGMCLEVVETEPTETSPGSRSLVITAKVWN